jgi:xylose isomerase
MYSHLSSSQEFKKVITMHIIKSICTTDDSEFSTVELLHIPSGCISTIDIPKKSENLQDLIEDTEKINKVLNLMKSEEEKKMLFEVLELAESFGWQEGYRDS